MLTVRPQSSQNLPRIPIFSCSPGADVLEIGSGSLFYNIIKNMYAVSKSCVKIDDTLSDFSPTQLGVKQGDNLSPNLFKIFINELPKYLEKSSDPVICCRTMIHYLFLIVLV
jgi:hypothetical protein